MPAKKQRPVNLRLTSIKFPMTAIVSILHRISGVLLFIFIPYCLCLLQKSLQSEESFAEVSIYFSQAYAKLIVWVILSAFIYHLFAGIRHLLLDFGVGESLNGGRISAWVTLLLIIISIGLTGYWLCPTSV